MHVLLIPDCCCHCCYYGVLLFHCAFYVYFLLF